MQDGRLHDWRPQQGGVRLAAAVGPRGAAHLSQPRHGCPGPSRPSCCASQTSYQLRVRAGEEKFARAGALSTSAGEDWASGLVRNRADSLPLRHATPRLRDLEL